MIELLEIENSNIMSFTRIEINLILWLSSCLFNIIVISLISSFCEEKPDPVDKMMFPMLGIIFSFFATGIICLALLAEAIYKLSQININWNIIRHECLVCYFRTVNKLLK